MIPGQPIVCVCVRVRASRTAISHRVEDEVVVEVGGCEVNNDFPGQSFFVQQCQPLPPRKFVLARTVRAAAQRSPVSVLVVV
jgi:hypothetical protein